MRVIPTLLPLIGAGLGVFVGIWLARRGRSHSTPPLPGHEGPAELEWLLRANGALGAWQVGPGSREMVAPAGGIPDAVDRAVQARLDHHRLEDGQQVERMEEGTLVLAVRDGRSAALLLAPGASTGHRAAALRDLARLLDIDRARVVPAELTRLEPGESPDESVDTVAWRLATQLERLLGTEVWVALFVREQATVRGVAQRSDKRLLGRSAEEGSPLHLVASGRGEAQEGVREPLGKAAADRRQRRDIAYLAPIPAGRTSLGAVVVWTTDGRGPQGPALAGFRKALDAAGPRFESALERNRLSEAARTDPLTGLLNRRGLEEVMSSVTAGMGALIYADIDHFKVLNDTLGHPAGDAALVHVARHLASGVRAADATARVGGEEFALWIPGASLEKGRQLAERLRQSLAFGDFKWQGQPVRLTASFGVAATPESSPASRNLPAHADAALYLAKQGGRNRVEVARRA